MFPKTKTAIQIYQGKWYIISVGRNEMHDRVNNL